MTTEPAVTTNQPLAGTISPSAPPPSHSVSASSADRLALLEATLPQLSKLSPPPTQDSIDCLRGFCKYTAFEPAEPHPLNKLAGVLILLHVNSVGGLSVTLTTRALTLRSHPGETALPGGRYDPGDRGVEGTALREANEEILLPLPPTTNLLHLATLPGFTSRTLLHVVPVVYLLLDQAEPILQGLVASPAEVAAIFHLPLKSFLGLPPGPATVTPPPPRRATRSSPVPPPPQPGTEQLDYRYEDYEWLDSRPYRLHIFEHADERVVPSRVSGLTADVLIAAALIGFHGLDAAAEAAEGRHEDRLVWRTGFERWAPGQMSWAELDAAARVARVQWGKMGKGLGDRRTADT